MNKEQNQPGYQGLFERFRSLQSRYGDIPADNLMAAYARAHSMRMPNANLSNPYIQNRRVKAVQTLPGDFTKDQVAEMIRSPTGNEQSLRMVSHGLEYTAYPLLKIRKTYTDIMTYHYYSFPAYVDKKDAGNEDLMREWALIEKISDRLNPTEQAHKIAGQAVQEGKVFYVPRMDVDKSHNQVNAAFMQQLPSDWTKIVGFNSESGYSVAFNLFYFFTPGADARQYGDLFTPYLDDFNSILSVGSEQEQPSDSRILYGTRNCLRRADGTTVGIDMETFKKNASSFSGNPDLSLQSGGRWAYWVTLPPERVWTFGIDDTNANASPIMTGLFLAMLQMAQYEQVQLELVQNPLVAVMTGEIPYNKVGESTQEDQYSLSDGGRTMFECLWYEMLNQNNTSGIGFFSGPFNNMKLHQLAEAPSAADLSAKGYAYGMEKSGLASLIPVSDNPRAGLVNFSAMLEAKFAQCIYWTFSRMMESLYRQLNTKYTWKFRMFGDITSDKETMKDIQKSMSSGIMPDLFLYNALMGRSTLDDLSMSRVLGKTGIMDLRLPLISSYNASTKERSLPPVKQKEAPMAQNEGGRPSADVGEVVSEGTEDNLDQ